MTGIDELFRSYSEPDEFAVQVQLELFAWARKQHALSVAPHNYGTYINLGCRCDWCRAAYRVYIRKYRSTTKTHVCGQCGVLGHNRRTCQQARAA